MAVPHKTTLNPKSRQRTGLVPRELPKRRYFTDAERVALLNAYAPQLAALVIVVTRDSLAGPEADRLAS